MALPTHYATGTASVNNAATAVTGQSTNWLSAGIQPGDLFCAAGLSVRVAAVVSNTQLTLAEAWPGATRTASDYELRYAADLTRALAASIDLLGQLANGNLSALAELTTAADKVPFYTGAGTADLADFTSAARTLLAQTSKQALREAGLGGGAIGSSVFTASTPFIALGNAKVAYSFTLGDDAATYVQMGQGNGAVVLWHASSSGRNGVFGCRVGSANAIADGYSSVNTAVNYLTTALAGTTGPDAALNFGAADDGKLYIENRLGGTATWYLYILSPILQ